MVKSKLFLCFRLVFVTDGSIVDVSNKGASARLANTMLLTTDCRLHEISRKNALPHDSISVYQEVSLPISVDADPQNNARSHTFCIGKLLTRVSRRTSRMMYKWTGRQTSIVWRQLLCGYVARDALVVILTTTAILQQ